MQGSQTGSATNRKSPCSAHSFLLSSCLPTSTDSTYSFYLLPSTCIYSSRPSRDPGRRYRRTRSREEVSLPSFRSSSTLTSFSLTRFYSYASIVMISLLLTRTPSSRFASRKLKLASCRKEAKAEDLVSRIHHLPLPLPFLHFFSFQDVRRPIDRFRHPQEVLLYLCRQPFQGRCSRSWWCVLFSSIPRVFPEFCRVVWPGRVRTL